MERRVLIVRDMLIENFLNLAFEPPYFLRNYCFIFMDYKHFLSESKNPNHLKNVGKTLMY